MRGDFLSREQRLRIQAELQALYTNLASFREREASYMSAASMIPAQFGNQINETRQKIQELEAHLLDYGDESAKLPGHDSYQQAYQAEMAARLDEARRLYRQAAKQGHPDADAALRSVRYVMKLAERQTMLDRTWLATPTSQQRRRAFAIIVATLFFALILILVFIGPSFPLPNTAAALPTGTPTIPLVVLLDVITPSITPTPSPPPTNTPQPPTQTAVPPATATATETSTVEASLTPTPKTALRPPLTIIGPRDGLVWPGGAIVFEFEKLNLADNELYCLNTLRGYDETNTENWSFSPVGKKVPSIPIEANVFQIARSQGMRCITWTAAIGRGSCDNLVSELTPVRMIGLPNLCVFDKN